MPKKHVLHSTWFVPPLILAISIAAKLFWVLTDQSWSFQLPVSPILYLVGIAAELFFIAVLVSCPSAAGKCIVGLVCFGCLTLASFWIMWSGSDCNCFGKLPLSRWLPIVCSIGCCGFYAVEYYKSQNVKVAGRDSLKCELTEPLFLGNIAAATIIGIILIFSVGFKSGVFVIGVRQGSSQGPIEIQSIQFFQNATETSGIVLVQVRNPNSFDIEIVGYKPSCHCIATVAYPRTIPSHQEARLQIDVRLSDFSEDQEVRIFYSGSQLSSLRVPVALGLVKSA